MGDPVRTKSDGTMVIDNTELFIAAGALEREAAVCEAHCDQGPIDDAPEELRLLASRLRFIAERANDATIRVSGLGKNSGVALVVQGVSGPEIEGWRR